MEKWETDARKRAGGEGERKGMKGWKDVEGEDWEYKRKGTRTGRERERGRIKSGREEQQGM